METKSRYQVIAELERQRRELMQKKQQLDNELFNKRRGIKELTRTLEDEQEELNELIENRDESRRVIDEMIKSVDQTLQQFNKK